MELFVKIYEDGIFTPQLAQLKEGDDILLTDPIGKCDITKLVEAETVAMFAAGTGITPMVNLIVHRINQTRKTHVFWFNRQAKDIVEDTHWPFSFKDPNVSITHILSEPSAEWNGLSGRLSKEMFQRLKDGILCINSSVFICGPLGFNALCAGLAEEEGFSLDQVVVFQ
jgi:NAD(P)H-flavin reductase